MMLPSQVTLIPQFILFKNLGWLDTLLPLIVPTFYGLARRRLQLELILASELCVARVPTDGVAPRPSNEYASGRSLGGFRERAASTEVAGCHWTT